MAWETYHRDKRRKLVPRSMVATASSMLFSQPMKSILWSSWWSMECCPQRLMQSLTPTVWLEWPPPIGTLHWRREWHFRFVCQSNRSDQVRPMIPLAQIKPQRIAMWTIRHEPKLPPYLRDRRVSTIKSHLGELSTQAIVFVFLAANARRKSWSQTPKRRPILSIEPNYGWDTAKRNKQRKKSKNIQINREVA